jgi:hypothetical protein
VDISLCPSHSPLTSQNLHTSHPSRCQSAIAFLHDWLPNFILPLALPTFRTSSQRTPRTRIITLILANFSRSFVTCQQRSSLSFPNPTSFRLPQLPVLHVHNQPLFGHLGTRDSTWSGDFRPFSVLFGFGILSSVLLQHYTIYVNATVKRGPERYIPNHLLKTLTKATPSTPYSLYSYHPIMSPVANSKDAATFTVIATLLFLFGLGFIGITFGGRLCRVVPSPQSFQLNERHRLFPRPMSEPSSSTSSLLNQFPQVPPIAAMRYTREPIPPTPTFPAPLPPLPTEPISTSASAESLRIPGITVTTPTPRNSYEAEYRDLFTGPVPSRTFRPRASERPVNYRLLNTSQYAPLGDRSSENLCEMMNWSLGGRGR